MLSHGGEERHIEQPRDVDEGHLHSKDVTISEGMRDSTDGRMSISLDVTNRSTITRRSFARTRIRRCDVIVIGC